jgi:hypothetical protein
MSSSSPSGSDFIDSALKAHPLDREYDHACLPSLGTTVAFRILSGPLVAFLEWGATIYLVQSLRHDVQRLWPDFLARVEGMQGEGAAPSGAGSEKAPPFSHAGALLQTLKNLHATSRVVAYASTGGSGGGEDDSTG